jgi:hypothetical protein
MHRFDEHRVCAGFRDLDVQPDPQQVHGADVNPFEPVGEDHGNPSTSARRRSSPALKSFIIVRHVPALE